MAFLLKTTARGGFEAASYLLISREYGVSVSFLIAFGFGQVFPRIVMSSILF